MQQEKRNGKPQQVRNRVKVEKKIDCGKGG